MAKVVFGGLVSEVRGTLGADVYTRNKSGGIVRTQTTNEWVPTTLRGWAVDTIVAVLSLWSNDLTPSERDAWNAFAAVQSRSHTAIAQTQLSGQNWFVKLNVPLYGFFETAIFLPPADLSVTPLTQLSITGIDVSDTAFNITWQPPIPANVALIVKATDSISAGRSSWTHELGLASARFDLNEASANIWSDYITQHPVPVANLKIGITARLLNGINGVYSRPLQANAIVEA
jgi:hypothetical protein